MARMLQLLVGVGFVALATQRARFGAARVPTDPVGALREATQRNPTLAMDGDLARYGPPCDAGEGAACVSLGVAYEEARDELEGQRLPRCIDYALFDRGCDAGDLRGCYHLGLRVLAAECGGTEAYGLSLLERACKGLVFEACDARARRRG